MGASNLVCVLSIYYCQFVISYTDYYLITLSRALPSLLTNIYIFFYKTNTIQLMPSFFIIISNLNIQIYPIYTKDHLIRDNNQYWSYSYIYSNNL